VLNHEETDQEARRGRPFAGAPKYSAGSNFEPFFLLAILGFGRAEQSFWRSLGSAGAAG